MNRAEINTLEQCLYEGKRLRHDLNEAAIELRAYDRVFSLVERIKCDCRPPTACSEDPFSALERLIKKSEEAAAEMKVSPYP